MKMNSVTDVDFIKKVSEASCAGVRVDLIVRGICCILPGVPGFTENVRVMSVVGRYLEHPRIFSFGTGKEQKIYIGSADMMTRNTEKRVEVACPVLDGQIRRQINHDLKIMLSDHAERRHIYETNRRHKSCGLPGSFHGRSTARQPRRRPTGTGITGFFPVPPAQKKIKAIRDRKKASNSRPHRLTKE